MEAATDAVECSTDGIGLLLSTLLKTRSLLALSSGSCYSKVVSS